MDIRYQPRALLVSTLLFCATAAANTAKDPCESYAPDATLTDQEQLAVKQACSAEAIPLACMKNKTAEQYDLNYAASIYSFLGACKNPASDNYKKAKAELALVALSEEQRQLKIEQTKTEIAAKVKQAEDELKREQLPANQTNKPWLVTLSVGSQHLPDYQGGESSGLSKTQAFAEVIADYRSEDINKNEIHWGAFISLEGQPVNRADASAVNDIEFNDVANTLTSGVYYIDIFDHNSEDSSWRSFFAPKEGELKGSKDSRYTHYSSKWGWGAKVSMRARESFDDKKDAIDPIGEFGLHYRYDEHNGLVGAGNVMPKGSLSFGIGYWHNYEEYLSQFSSTGNRWRYLVRGEYRLSDMVPAYLGFKGNLGSGPDNLGVYLSLRMKSDKLLGLLTDEK